MKFHERLYRGYAPWSLFLSSYAPLSVIFALRLFAKSRPVKAECCLVIAALLALNVLFVFLANRDEPQDFVAAKVEPRNGELAAYVATYLLPFVVVGDVTNWDLAAYLVYLFVVGIISVQGEFLQYNPLLAVLGFRLYFFADGSDRRYLALSRLPLHDGDDVEAREIRPRLLVVVSKGNRT